MNNIKELFESFNKLRILIIGDVMLDSYLKGKVERISPEAPVPIVAIKENFSRLGGAANVAQNVKALGAEPVLCSIVGKDDNARQFFALMKEHQLPLYGIIQSDERITTCKTRIIGNNAQMLRVDNEDVFDLTEKEYGEISKKIHHIINTEKIDGIVFQDYNKGVLTEKLITETIAEANKKGIPIAVDPKKKNFLAYKNSTFFKPNLKELKEGVGIDFPTDTIECIMQGVNALQNNLNCRYVMTTLSERGVLISENGGNYSHIKAHLRKIADVSGAGDTVLSVATLCLAMKQDAHLIAALSNLAGGLVCEELGAVPVNKERLLDEAIRLI